MPNSSRDGAERRLSGHPLVVVLMAGGGGILLDRFATAFSPQVWWCVATVCWAVWLLLWQCGSSRLSAWLLLGSVAMLMGARHHDYWNVFPDDHLGRRATADAQPACVECVALQVPLLRPVAPTDPLQTIPQGPQSSLRVSARRIRDRDRWIAASGVVDLRVDGQLLGIQPGDLLRVFGVLQRSAPAQNPGQRDQSLHDRAERVLCRLRASYPDCVTVIKAESRPSFLQAIRSLRGRGERLLDRYVGHQRSGLAAAILLGTRERLSREKTEAFFHTGTIHLLAISGLHVGILAWAFFFVARSSLAPTKVALIAVMVLTLVYAVITESRAPVLRATILVQVICLGWLWHRPALAFNSLAAAALIVLAIRPPELFRAGAQLSFLAVATLTWLGHLWIDKRHEDPLERLIWRSRPWYSRLFHVAARRVWQLSLASAAIWLVTLPLVMRQFHLIAPVALLLNVVLWVPVAVALFSGFGVLLFGWLIPPIAHVCGSACDLSLAVLDGCVQQVHQMPMSYFWVGGTAWWWVVVFYVALAAAAFLPAVRPPRRWLVAMLLVWLAVPSATSLARQQGWLPWSRALTCTLLSVGHGTCVVAELPTGRTIMYDAGRMGTPEPGADLISGFLWWRGIEHLDAVIISHADADHYNALPTLLDRFSVGAVYVSPVMFRESSPAMEVLRSSIQRASVPLRETYAGDVLETSGGVRIEVLHPLRRGVIGSDNANSIVLDISYGGQRILLPGDLEPPGLQDVMADEPLDCDVLMAPHHGSARSNPSEFSSWCTPEAIVVSGGRRFGTRDAAGQLVEEGYRVLHTGYDGAVVVTLTPNRCEVRPWL